MPKALEWTSAQGHCCVTLNLTDDLPDMGRMGLEVISAELGWILLRTQRIK